LGPEKGPRSHLERGLTPDQYVGDQPRWQASGQWRVILPRTDDLGFAQRQEKGNNRRQPSELWSRRPRHALPRDFAFRSKCEEKALVRIEVLQGGEANLFQIIGTTDSGRGFPNTLHGRQQKSNQDSNDGKDCQHLNEREPRKSLCNAVASQHAWR